MTSALTEGDRRYLVARARSAAARALGVDAAGGDGPAPAGRPSEPGCAFVTWKRDGRLRGCIGSVEPVRPLAEDVAKNAVSALLHDPRFAPATVKDWPRLRVEISVLSPWEALGGPSEIEIGRHGLYVAKGKRRGLLLPQVAAEWSYGPEEFLTQTCLKAGLPGEAWRAAGGDLAIYLFEADVFGETPAGRASA